MTEVRYTERKCAQGTLMRLQASGHCGLIESGVDVGCRASSCLACALADAAAGFESGGSDIKDGEAIVTVVASDEEYERASGCFHVARAGFAALEKMYPDNFRYEEKIDG